MNRNTKTTIISALFLLTAMTLKARTFDGPTMGWSSWNTFGVNISESIIKGQADAMVNQGLADVGYNYINIDDGFQYGRNLTTGLVTIHPTRFPRGIKVVATYIHSKGLKAGIYSDAGDLTCGSLSNGDSKNTNVGMYGYDQKDANYYFKTCGFDFIKVDYCGGSHLSLNEQERYTAIHEAMVATGVSGLKFNVCRWAYPGTWVSDVADSWRTTGDINCSWSSVKSILAENLYLAPYCHDGHYNDMDMLEVGRSLGDEVDRTHFGMWCIMSSPLLIGCDLRTLRPTTLELLKNTELIALNQDSLGLQAYVALQQGDTYVLVKDIEQRFGKTRAVAFYNPTDEEQRMAVAMSDLDLGGTVKVRDLYEHSDLDPVTNELVVTVPARGCRIYRLEAETRLERNLYEAETAYLTCYQEIKNNQSVGSAIYETRSNASGGMTVEWLGAKPENDMQWQHVWSADGGDYQMTLTYATKDARPLTLQVNGEDVISRDMTTTGSYTTYGKWTQTITLQPGENTIRLYTASDSYMPNIDCMTLQPVGSQMNNDRKISSLRAQVVGAMADGLPTALIASAQTTVDKYLDPTSLTASQKTTAITKLQNTLTLLQTAQTEWDKLQPWVEAVEQNMEVCAESDAKTTYADKLTSKQASYDACTTQARITAVSSSYLTLLKTFFTNANLYPKTDEYFDFTILTTNPDFNSVDGGWADAPTYRADCAEFYQKTFDMKQTVTGLRAGNYRVGLQALYRVASNNAGSQYKAGTEVIPARLYAGADSIPIVSVFSYVWPDASGYGSVDQDNGYVNSMSAAEIVFGLGAYQNWVDTKLEDAGSLTFGIMSAQSQSNSWCCFDKLKLLYRPFDSEDAIVLPAQVSADKKSKGVYDLSGKLQSQPLPKKRILIVDGKKVLLPR